MKTILLDSRDQGFPENLKGLPESPRHLYVLGDLRPRDRMAVAIVGTRRASSLGRSIAQEIAQDLTRAGITVVSGLAKGIDAAAHQGAIQAGGRTIACLGAGPDVHYPKENEHLYGAIPLAGALVSEYPEGTPPAPWRFPARNRIIAGMSLGVVVVEAPRRSGALITVDWALKYGRPVMVVPGSAKSPLWDGSNGLIQDGAYLATSASDVLSFLGREGSPA